MAIKSDQSAYSRLESGALVDLCWGAGARWLCISATFCSKAVHVLFGRTHFPEDLSHQPMSEDDGGAGTLEDY